LKHGRRIGQPPLGFMTDADGYLIPNCEFYGEDYNGDRDGFFAVPRAVEEIDEGEELPKRRRRTAVYAAGPLVDRSG